MKTVRGIEIQTAEKNPFPVADWDGAIAAHLEWLDKMDQLLQGKISLTLGEAVDHTQCKLGRWLYAYGLKNYAFISCIEEIEQKHIELHAKVREIIEAVAQNRRAKAKKLYEDLLVISKDLVRLMQFAQMEDRLADLDDALVVGAEIQKFLSRHSDEPRKYFKSMVEWSKARDGVSGDFFHCTTEPDHCTLFLGDCTGHGIAAAMVGIYVQTIIKGVQATFKTDNLPELVRYIVGYFHHLTESKDTDTVDKQIDFEFAAVRFHPATRRIEYCGEGIDLWIGRDGGVVKASPDDKGLVCKEIDAHSGDRFFMYTDGIADQFGGPELRKLGRKRIHSLLMENAHLSLAEQVDALKDLFWEWKKGARQTDDITFIAFEV
jgi:hypothetical protein